MKNNRKGMTLAEVIIAMGVFAVATTGFIMTATACYKAQTKTQNRMENSNTQTTNLEHFSNYNQVVDPEDLNVEPMSGGSNRWVMTFPFTGGGSVVNNKVYGYYSVADPDDPVYDLSFFSPIEQVPLDEGEYWINLFNNTSSDAWLQISIIDSTQFEFFDNEKVSKGSDLPERLWGANGGCRRFGVRSLGGDASQPTIRITNVDSGDTFDCAITPYLNSDDGYAFMHRISDDEVLDDAAFDAMSSDGEE